MIDDDYQFLSSLSPRDMSKKKNKTKGPTVLSLKKYFRRSSICHRVEATIPNKSLEIIEISSSDSYSSDKENYKGSGGIQENRKHCSKFKSSDSSSPSVLQSDLSLKGVVSPSPQKSKSTLKYFSTEKPKTSTNSKSYGTLTRTKLFDINKWLEDSEHSNKKEIQGDEVIEDSFLSYDVFEVNGKSNSNIINSTVRQQSPSPKSSDRLCVEERSCGSNTDGTIDKSYEDLLDALYGSSWRAKKNEIFPSSEKKIRRPKVAIPQTSKSERCPRVRKKGSLGNEKSKSTRILGEIAIKNVDDYLETSMNALHLNNVSVETVEKTSILTSNNKNTLGLHLNKISEPKTEKINDFGSENHWLPAKGKESDNDDCQKKKSRTKNKKKVKIVSKKRESYKGNDYENEENISIESGIQRPYKTEGSLDGLSSNGKIVQPTCDSYKTPVQTKSLRKKWEVEETYSFLASLSTNIPDSKCNQTARIFKKTYKESKEILTKELFLLFNERVFKNALPVDMKLEWSDRMVSTAGYCYSRKITNRKGNVERTARIVLSTKVLDRAERLRDTLIHEMCHAATWIVNQVQDAHGSYWKAWANKAEEEFPELPPIKTCHNFEVQTKYIYKCTGCGYSIRRHRKSLDIERKRCGYCHGQFEILMNKTNKKGETKIVPTTPKKTPTGFALFVKENYSNLKTPDLNHAGMMKLLSQKFKEIKV